MTSVNTAQLNAIASFLHGLTELTHSTGVVLGGHMRPMIEVDDGQLLTIDVQRNPDTDDVTYALDLEA